MAEKLLVYAGSANSGTGGFGYTEKVVLKLNVKLNIGHAVYMDNFYNSVALSQQIMQAKIYTAGTISAICGGNPQNITSRKIFKDKFIFINKKAHGRITQNTYLYLSQ